MKHKSNNVHYRKLINSVTWRRLRFCYLQQHPLCERCKEADKYTPATDVHHINPIEWATTLEAMTARAYNPTNLMALCPDCHAEVHRELSSHSKEAQRNNNKRKTERFIRSYLD